MKISLAHDKSFTVPAKAEPTQEMLGDEYDELESALNFIECVYQATCMPAHDNETVGPLRNVLEVAKNKVAAAKSKLHGAIAWYP